MTLSWAFHHSKTMVSLVDIQYLILIVSIFINFKILQQNHSSQKTLGLARWRCTFFTSSNTHKRTGLLSQQGCSLIAFTCKWCALIHWRGALLMERNNVHQRIMPIKKPAHWPHHHWSKCKGGTWSLGQALQYHNNQRGVLVRQFHRQGILARSLVNQQPIPIYSWEHSCKYNPNVSGAYQYIILAAGDEAIYLINLIHYNTWASSLWLFVLVLFLLSMTNTGLHLYDVRQMGVPDNGWCSYFRVLFLGGRFLSVHICIN